MIKPPELDSAEGDIVWNALNASHDGDVDALRRLFERDPRLSRAEYWYTPAIHFAVREDTWRRCSCCSTQAPIRNGTDCMTAALSSWRTIGVMPRSRGSWKRRGTDGAAS